MRQSLSEWISQRAGIQRRSKASHEPHFALDSELDRYIDRVKQLLGIARQQEFELAEERKKRRRAERELADTRNLLKGSERSRRQNRRILRSASRELNSLRLDSKSRAVIKLREKTEQIHGQYSSDLINERDRRIQVQAELDSARAKIKSLNRSATPKHDELPSISDRVLKERQKRRKAEKENKSHKQNLAHVRRQLKSLQNEHKKCRRNPKHSDSNGNKYTPALLQAILPNLTVVRDNVSYGNSPTNAKQMLDDLMLLNDSPQLMRAERVGGAKHQWFELRPTLSERIYYRKSGYNSRYLVLLGDKKSQPRDLDWMRKN